MNWWEELEPETDEQANVTYTDFVECQYCGARLGHGDTGALNSHWRECKQHPAQTEINRLRAINTRLRAACEEARKFAEDRPGIWAARIVEQLDEALALDSGTDGPPAPRLPGME